MALAYETTIAFSSTIQSQKPYNSIIMNCYASTDSVFSKIISDKEVAVFGEYKVLVFYRQPNAGRESSYKAFTLRKNFCEIVLFDTPEKEEIKADLILQSACKFNYISKSRLRSSWNIDISGEIRVSGIGSDSNNTTKSPDKAIPDEAMPAEPDKVDIVKKNSNNISEITVTNSANNTGKINLEKIIMSVNADHSNEYSPSDAKSSADSINAEPPEEAAIEDDNSLIDDSGSLREDLSINSEKNNKYNITSKVWQFEDSDSTKVEELMYMDFEALRKMDKD
ncbi:hypothetical protein LY28_03153 [Ruminiclostridium sufflavum DSM 19573]|uniref:Uncharacterized protein n=1 Tax=Ruminiclostridium sufflavum DSM 19573 TaxID=1121337 RepID=A0A318XKW4_9FIRM|nr:hypothetical protein [Ruminiclostridium sufflavum]PYG85734.1 hypothetical protein LY28_03153 [Ruminiclostridium sufflavum DSM 19573]